MFELELFPLADGNPWAIAIAHLAESNGVPLLFMSLDKSIEFIKSLQTHAHTFHK